MQGCRQKDTFSTSYLQDRNDMILAPNVVLGMRLEASLDEIQQIDYILYCL